MSECRMYQHACLQSSLLSPLSLSLSLSLSPLSLIGVSQVSSDPSSTSSSSDSEEEEEAGPSRGLRRREGRGKACSVDRYSTINNMFR